MKMGRYVVKNGHYVHESDLNRVGTRVFLSLLSIVMVFAMWWIAQFMV